MLVSLLRLRRVLAPTDFRDMLGVVMIEIEQGFEVALENAYRRRPPGNVIPFPAPVSGSPRNEVACPERSTSNVLG